MSPEEFRAVLKLYHAGAAVCSIPGYRWSRDQIDGTRRLLEEAGQELAPLLRVALRDLRESGQVSPADMGRVHPAE